MRNVLLWLGALFCSFANTPLHAQDIPDFSGKWTAVAEARPGKNAPALGESFVVTQIDTILQLTSDGSKRTLIIDGLPHEHRATPPVAPAAQKTPPKTAAPPRSEPTRSVTTARATSIVTWQDETLKIVTVEVQTTSQPTQTPDRIEARITTTLTWRLLPDGQLSVERTAIADPPMPGRQAAPVKTIYTRK